MTGNSFEEWRRKGLELAGAWAAQRADLVAENWPRSGLEWHDRSYAAVLACEMSLVEITHRSDWNDVLDEISAYNRLFKNHGFAEVDSDTLERVREEFWRADDDAADEYEADMARMNQRTDWFPWIVQQLRLDQRPDWPTLELDMKHLVRRMKDGAFAQSTVAPADEVSEDLLLADLLLDLIDCDKKCQWRNGKAGSDGN